MWNFFFAVCTNNSMLSSEGLGEGLARTGQIQDLREVHGSVKFNYRTGKRTCLLVFAYLPRCAIALPYERLYNRMRHQIKLACS